MKTIIAATNFTDISLNAVDYAVDMAIMIRAEVHLLHVSYASPTDYESPGLAPGVEEVKRMARERLDALKTKLLDKTKDRLIIHVEVRAGEVLSELEKYCNEVKPYAVVVGSETCGRVEEFLFGGETINAMYKLKWPVIIVPPLKSFTNIRKIGLASDFSDVAETLNVEKLKIFTDEFKPELHVIHVNTKRKNAAEPDLQSEAAHLQMLLGNWHPHYHIIANADIGDAINVFIEEQNPDILVIIPKKHNLLSKIFGSRHAEKLVKNIHLPVMTLPGS